MQVFTQFKHGDDVAHVTVQLSGDEYADLRQWMHTPDHELVVFLHGVKLLKRGFGWFRLEASKPFRAVDKLRASLALLRKWHADLARRRDQQQRVVAAKARGLVVEGYSSFTRTFTAVDPQGYKVAIGLNGNQVMNPEGRPLASTAKLQALVEKFARPR